MSTVWWLLNFARPATGTLTFSVLARTIGHLLGLLIIALPCWAVASIAIGAHTDTVFVITIVGVVALAAIVKAVLRYIEQLTGHLAAFSLLGELRVWLLDRLIPLAPGGLDRLGSTRVYQTAVRDVDRIEVFFAHTIAPVLTAAVVPIAAVCAAAWLAGPIMAVALAGVLLASVLLLVAAGRRGLARAVVETRTHIAAHIADTVRLRDEIEMYEAHQLRSDELAHLDERLGAQLRQAARANGLRAGGIDLRVWGGTLIMIAVALAVSSADVARLPVALAAASLVIGSAASVDAVVRLATSLPAGLAATERVRELADRKPPVDEPATPASATPGVNVAALEFADVSVHADGTPILQHVSFAVPAGGSIGIVGVSGSGKSTVARLAQRFWDPTSGEVRLHGTDARALGSVAVRKIVAMADQDPFVHGGTVRENLLLAAPEANEDAIRRACKLAQLDVDLDVKVGRRGAELSGGQRQRLTIARTLLRLWHVDERGDGELGDRDRILILDEATSYQDPLTQAALVHELCAASATLVVIAHRLETVRELDEILVMDAGEIVQRGTWDELVSAPGRFRELWQQQLVD